VSGLYLHYLRFFLYDLNMQLIPGIRVIPNQESIADAIEVNSGTTPASMTDYLNQCFEPGAIVPNDDWRGLTRDERDIVVGWPNAYRPGTWIAVYRVPEELLSPFDEARRKTRQSNRRGEVLGIWTESARAAKPAFDRFVWQAFSLRPDRPDSMKLSGGIRVNDPAMKTVTTRPKTSDLVGLHVDDWYSADVVGRDQSPNRISINIGVQDRFFLFVNLPVSGFFQLHREDTGDPGQHRISCTQLGRRFLLANPKYPVIRVRVKPGEAYVAPTENMLHDGSSIAMKAPDVVLSLHGDTVLQDPMLARRHFVSSLIRLE